MSAFETISGTVTAAGLVLVPWTMNGSDSLRLRNTPGNAYLLNVASDVVAPGAIQIVSSKLHDPTNAILLTGGGNGELMLPRDAMQKLFSGDLLGVSQSGSAVPGDIDSGTLFLWYDRLPGLDQNLIRFADFKRRFRNWKTVQVAHTPAVTGGYGGAVALSTTTTNLKGNTEYAILGFDTNTLAVGTVTFQGQDTQGLRIGIPFGNDEPDVNHRFFLQLAADYPDFEMIPVLNSQNNANTFLESIHSSVFSPAGTITLLLAELA